LGTKKNDPKRSKKWPKKEGGNNGLFFAVNENYLPSVLIEMDDGETCCFHRQEDGKVT